MSAAVVIGRDVPVTPFKFLNYYEEADAARFAGREREIDDIIGAIAHAPTLIVYGKSGLGKTSLFLAGVFPELARRNYLPVHVRTLQNPLIDVLRAVMDKLAPSEDAGRASVDASVPKLLQALRDLSADRPVVIVLDQFEEFFIRFRGRRDVYEAFIGAIGAIAADRSLRVHVVFSLREEYLADLDDFRANVPSLFENEYRLRPMTAFGVRQAITRPLEVAGIPFDTRLVSRLVDRLARDRFDSVVLQILCQEVFAHALERGASTHTLTLTEDDLEDAGDIDAIFRRYLDETAKALPAEQHLHARVVLRLLTTQERTKQALRVIDFTTGLYQLTEDEALAVLEVIREHKLLRVDPRGGDTWYELTHERLVPILEDWLRLDPQFNALLAAHDWIATPSSSSIWRAAPQNLLAPGHLTDVVGPFRARLALTTTELEFVVWSALYHRHDDITFWADRLGAEAARTLIREKLSDPLEEFRQGAAFSAGFVSAGDTPALDALVAVSLADEVEDVRREAGLALARIGTPETNAKLRRALKQPETRQRALQTLADLSGHGAKLDGFSRWHRYRARRIARRRALEDARTLINDATREGTFGGVFGAGAWTLSVALLYGILLSFVIAGLVGNSRFFWFVVCLGGALLGSMAIGALLSVFVSRALASRVVLTGDDNFAKALWTSKAFLTVPTLFTLFMLWVTYQMREDPYPAPPVLCATLLLVPNAYWLAVPIWVRFAQRAIHPTDGAWRRLAAALVSAAAVPILVPGLVYICLSRVGFSHRVEALQIAAALSLFAIPLGSGITACLAGSLLRMWMLYGTQLRATRVAPPPSSSLRALLPLLALASPVMAVAHLGWDVIPFVAPSSGVLSAAQKTVQIPLPLTPKRETLFETPHYRRFAIDAGEGRGAIIQPKGSIACLDEVRLDGQRLTSLDPIAILRGPHELALTPYPFGFVSSDADECKLQLQFLEPIADPNADDASKPGLPGGYFWADWRYKSADPLNDGPASRIHYEAVVSGVTTPNSLVVVELYKPFVLLSPSAAHSEPVAYCDNSGVSLVLSQVGHYTAWTELKVDATDQISCLTRADATGAWTTHLSLKGIASAIDRSAVDELRRVSLLRWKLAGQPTKGALNDQDAARLDAAFLALEGASLVKAQLKEATLIRASLRGANLSDANLRSADAHFVDLSDANLEDADLQGAQLDFANLKGARLAGAQLSHASLRGAHIVDVIVGDSSATIDLTDANLERATLTGLPRDARIDLRGAKLVGANLQGLDVAGADFTGADMLDTNLSGARLSGVLGLTTEQLRAACGDGDVDTASGKFRLRTCSPSPRGLPVSTALALCTAAPTSDQHGPDHRCGSVIDAKLDGRRLRWGDAGCSCPFDARFGDMLENGMLISQGSAPGRKR